jgi:hypothetical protein
MQQAEDCRQECHALAAVLDPLGEADFDRITQFKDWTLKDVIGHLHIFNAAAEKALEGDAAFQAFLYQRPQFLTREGFPLAQKSDSLSSQDGGIDGS